jgi:hypothetical protein
MPQTCDQLRVALPTAYSFRVRWQWASDAGRGGEFIQVFRRVGLAPVGTATFLKQLTCG